MLLGPVWMQASIDNTCMNKWLDRPFSMNQTYLPGATSHADARGRTRYGETNIFSSLTNEICVSKSSVPRSMPPDGLDASIIAGGWEGRVDMEIRPVERNLPAVPSPTGPCLSARSYRYPTSLVPSLVCVCSANAPIRVMICADRTHQDQLHK